MGCINDPEAHNAGGNALHHHTGGREVVSQTTSIAFLLAVSTNSPYKTLAELIAAAKAKPGEVKFGSAGIGNQSQLAAELLAGASGAKMLHVPYKGESPAITDLGTNPATPWPVRWEQ